MNYVLVSPVRDEEALIRNTLESVCAQSVVPKRWVIVDNGSSDGTADIVLGYSKRFPWIELVSHATGAERNFAAKAQAFSAGFSRIRSLEFEVIGNVDADVSFDPNYMGFLMRKFAEDPDLGVAGTPFVEDGYDSARDSFEGVNHVAGGVQLFRRQCFEEIGGYVPNYAGGIDWIAVTTARMKGWKTRSFPDNRFKHYRTVGTATRGTVTAFFSYGEKDYYLGGAPVWQLFRVCYRLLKRPFIVGGVAVALGYTWAALRGMPRVVSPELMRFHRAEQRKKLKTIISGGIGKGFRAAAGVARRIKQSSFVSLCLLTCTASVSAQTYSTTFGLTENPVSENHRWINGKDAGLDWANASTTPGLAIGRQSGSAGYDDATALVVGSWGPDQSVQAKVHTENQNDGFYEEVELRLRSTLSPHINTGYEINFRCLKTSRGYMQIVRWNGLLGDFTYLVDKSGAQYGVANGDVVRRRSLGT